MQTPQDWWKDYFSANYGTLYRGPLAPELSTSGEVETLRRLFSETPGPVLDLGCGFGRHLVGLRRAKVPAYGVDYSADLIRQIPAAQRKYAVRGDIRRLPFADASFSGACMLFNTFGYFAEEDNGTVLAEVARVLKPGAPLVLDIPARSGMRAVVHDLPASIRTQGDTSIYEAWSYDDATHRLLARGTWSIKEITQEWELSIRLYTPAEIGRLLRRAGFRAAPEIRPNEDFELLGTGNDLPPDSAGFWRTVTNMAVLARR